MKYDMQRVGFFDVPLPGVTDHVRVLPQRLRDVGYYTANIRRIGNERLGTGKEHLNFHVTGTLFDTDRWEDLKQHQPIYAQVNFRYVERNRKEANIWLDYAKLPRIADPAAVELPPYFPDHPTARHEWAMYLNSVCALDRDVGIVLEKLKEDGLANTTVVIFFGDNGRLEARGLGWCYDGGLQVPMIIHWPLQLTPPPRVVLQDGRVTSLFDKTRHLEHVSAEADPARGVFKIQLVRGIKPAEELDAVQMACEVSRHTADLIELAFHHPRATARVQVRLSQSPGESHWSMSVEPKDAEFAVGHVTYPVIVTPRSVRGEEKRYLFPMFEGRFAPLSQPPMWRAHPSHLFAQMIACVAPAGGFVVWTDDGDGHVKAFGFTNRGPAAEFGARHLMPYEAGQAWKMPYDTRVTFCGGTWQDAADVYREWATAPPWSNTPLRDRQDVPELLRHPPLCISTQLDRERLDDLPDRLAAWGKRFDVPVVYRPLGWEKHGNWVGIDYFPPSIGEEAFRNLAARLKERGIFVSGFISGYRWTTHSQRASRDTNAVLANYFTTHDGDQTCERARDGHVLGFLAEGRDSHRVCRGADFGLRFLPETARSLFDLGVTTIHDDQDHGSNPDGAQSCFDRAHGHPVPCGPWSTDATRQSFQEIRAEAARRGLTDFFLTKESCTDLLNMYLHAYQARFFHESTHPDLVPLAQYLYHEHIPVIFGWVTANSRSTWESAAMLVYGQIPSLAFWNASAERPDAIPATAVTLLDDYFAAMKTHAKPFLLYGRMRRPLIVDAPFIRKEIRQIRGRALRRPQGLITPLVIQSAWDDGQGNVGVYAVNTQERSADLKLQSPDEGRWCGVFYTGSTHEEEQEVAGGEQLSWHLEPGRLGAVVFRRIE